jgi:hypothetical protein
MLVITLTRRRALMNTRDFNLVDFNEIELDGAVEAEITRSDVFKVNVVADDLSHIKVEKVNNRLVVRRQGIEWFAPFHSRPRAEVTLPSLTYLYISGASRGKIENFQSQDNLNINLSGASQLEVQNISTGQTEIKVSGASSLCGEIKTTKDTKIEASGASKIELTGKGIGLQTKTTGASKVELSKFEAQTANVEVSGASTISINLNGKLNANISGASNLFWTGSPVMGDIQTSGASNLHHR